MGTIILSSQPKFTDDVATSKRIILLFVVTVCICCIKQILRDIHTRFLSRGVFVCNIDMY